MAEDKKENERILEIGIQTDPVVKINCSGCGVEIDTTGIDPFSEIECPSCKERQTVPAMLGNFRLLKVIGAGGMGAVFLAKDDRLNRKVAVKVMLSSIGSDPAILATFRKEAQAAARLNHPNIVQIYSFGEEKGQPYLVMELVDGGSLDGFIESGTQLDPAFVMRVGMEIAEGLTAAQNASLLHGDIKPENILFDEHTQAKLVDFGIASMLGSKSKNNEVWGTPYYIAPEKARRQKTDQRSDIYSLGATLYHAIAGHPPFDGPDPISVIKARFAGPAPSLTEVRPGINPQVVAIIERMMQTNLFLRYPNYGSLVKDIKKYLAMCPASTQAGPSGKKIRLKNTGTGVLTEDVSTRTSSAGGLEEGSANNTGTTKKRLVIQRGSTAAAVNTVKISTRHGSLSGDSVQGENSDSTVQTVEKPERQINPNAAKKVAIAMFVFFGLLIISAVGGLVGYGVKQHNLKKALDFKYIQVKALDSEYDKLKTDLDASYARISAVDAESTKILENLAIQIKDAVGESLLIPDLEPQPEPVAENTEETAQAEDGAQEESKQDKSAAATAGAKVASDVSADESAPVATPKTIQKVVGKKKLTDEEILEKLILKIARDEEVPAKIVRNQIESGERNKVDGKFGSAAAGAVSPIASEENITETVTEQEGASEPDSEAPVVPVETPKHPIIEKASPLFDYAREIRKRLRKAEVIATSEDDLLTVPKREKFSDGIWMSFNNRSEKRQKDINDIDIMTAECSDIIKQMKKYLLQVEKETKKLLAEKRKQEEEKANAEIERKKNEQAERKRLNEKAKVQAEIDKIKSDVDSKNDAIDKYEYTKVIRSLERIRPELAYPEATQLLDDYIAKFNRLESLKRFIIDDLHRNKGLRWGLGHQDIVDAGPNGIVAVNNKLIPTQSVAVAQWMYIIDMIFMKREPKRSTIRPTEFGEQCFNVAIFCFVHGRTNVDGAKTKALEYLHETMRVRTALRSDILRLLPEITEADLDAK